jgi:hypothetical protein
MPSPDSPESSAQPSARVLALMEEIQARLAPVCAETPPALFNEMVLRIAHVQLRYEEELHLRTALPVRK